MDTHLAVGFGGFGQLCDDNCMRDRRELAPVESLARLRIQEIAVSLWNALLVDDKGSVYSAGKGRYGALGLGDDKLFHNQLSPALIPALKNMRCHRVACGERHGLVLTVDGRIWSMGFGFALGNGSQELQATPKPIDAMVQYTVVDIAAGGFHSACVTSCGKLFSWGRFGSRNPEQFRSNDELQELESHHFVSVVCGEKHLVARTDAGDLVEIGPHGARMIRVKGDIKERWVQAACGTTHTIALTSAGNVYLWGFLKKGCNDPDGVQPYPVLVTLPDKQVARNVYSGMSFFAILNDMGQVFTWGKNTHYNLGHGHRNDVAKPTLVDSISTFNVKKCFAGGQNMFFTCGESVSRDNLEMLHEGNLHDIVIRSGSIDRKAHQCMLACRSQKLMELLQEKNDDSNVLDVSDLIPEAHLDHILEFIYANGVADVSDELARTLRQALQNIGIANVEIRGNNIWSSPVSYRRDIKKMVNNEAYFPDVHFALDDNVIMHAHRCILSRVEYFGAMFSNGMLESYQSTIDLMDAGSESLLMLFTAVYTGKLEEEELDTQHLVELLELATRTNSYQTKFLCEKRIIDELADDNVVQVLQVSEYCQASTLRRSCLQFLAKMSSTDLDTMREDIDADVMVEIDELREEARQNEILQEERRLNNLREQEEQRQQPESRRLAQAAQEDEATVRNILGGRRRDGCSLM